MNVLLLRLCAANFLSSFGGGSVLGNGLSFLSQHALVPVDSVFAYLIGACLSLFLILRLRKGMESLWPASSLVASILAIILYQMAMQIQVVHASSSTLSNPWLFFAVLCGFFALVSVPRAFRADLAAQTKHVSWAELAYSGGYMTSLAASRWFPDPTLLNALLAAVICMAVASVLDAWSAPKAIAVPVHTIQPDESSSVVSNVTPVPSVAKTIFWTLLLTTAGVQIVIQRLMSTTADSLPFLAFEIGVTLAPMVLLSGKGTLENFRLGLGASKFQLYRSAPFPLLVFVPLGLTAVAAALTPHVHPWVLVPFFLSAALLYEIAAILLLDALPSVSPAPAPVASAFGWLGLAMAVLYGLFVVLSVDEVGCTIFAAGTMVAQAYLFWRYRVDRRVSEP